MRSVFLAGLLSTTMAFGAPKVTVLHAQATTTTQQTTTADQSGDKAKSHADQAADDAKDAGKSAGKAAKEAGKATAEGTKSVAKTAAKGTKKAGKETKKAAGAIKDDVTGDHKNATAKCGDGTYWYSADRTGACKDHGGVAEWITK